MNIYDELYNKIKQAYFNENRHLGLVDIQKAEACIINAYKHGDVPRKQYEELYMLATLIHNKIRATIERRKNESTSQNG